MLRLVRSLRIPNTRIKDQEALWTRVRKHSTVGNSAVQRTAMAVETAKGGSRLSISITEQCLQRLRALASRQNDSLPPALRITVNSGGCAGFQYEFKLEHGEPLADDYVFERDGVRVYVDALSAPMITGSTLDYEEELIRSAFKIETNPNAEAGCSCGTSFAPKL